MKETHGFFCQGLGSSHGRSQDFFRGGGKHFFKKIFKKFSKNIQKNSNNFQKY